MYYNDLVIQLILELKFFMGNKELLNQTEQEKTTNSLPISPLEALKKQKSDRGCGEMKFWRKGYEIWTYDDRVYIIDRKLGKGGNGITYLASDEENQKVAIKVVRQSNSQNDEGKSRGKLVQEAFNHNRFKHKYIVPTQDIIQDRNSGKWCIVMDYVEGKNLKEFLVYRNSCLDESEALYFIRQISEALEAVVHANQYIHGDIKPENILICDNPEPKALLIDFGTVTKFKKNSLQPTSGQLTRKYAAPELNPSEAELGSYTDVYSLAATLYYLVTGEVPTTTAKRGEGESLVLPKSLNKQISEKLDRVIQIGMTTEFKNRPTIDEWLILLDAIQDEKKITSERIQKVEKPDRLKNWLWLLGIEIEKEPPFFLKKRGFIIIVSAILTFLGINTLPLLLQKTNVVETTVYEAPNGQFKIDYPLNWSKRDSGYSMFNPVVAEFFPVSHEKNESELTNKIFVRVEEDIGLQSLSDYVKTTEERHLKKQYSQLEILEEEMVSIGENNLKGYSRVYRYFNDQGQEIKTKELITLDNQKAYVFIYQAETEEYQKYEKIFNEVIMNSFELSI